MGVASITRGYFPNLGVYSSSQTSRLSKWNRIRVGSSIFALRRWNWFLPIAIDHWAGSFVYWNASTYNAIGVAKAVWSSAEEVNQCRHPPTESFL